MYIASVGSCFKGLLSPRRNEPKSFIFYRSRMWHHKPLISTARVREPGLRKRGQEGGLFKYNSYLSVELRCDLSKQGEHFTSLQDVFSATESCGTDADGSLASVFGKRQTFLNVEPSGLG